MRLKYQILEAECGCIVHLEWDEHGTVGQWRAIDPDTEVVAHGEPGHADTVTARDQWRTSGRGTAKWSSTITRDGLKRKGCGAHWHEDHHQHLHNLRTANLSPGQQLIVHPDRSCSVG